MVSELSGIARTQSHTNKLCVRVSTLGRNRRGQPPRSGMWRPRPGPPLCLIRGRPTPGKYEKLAVSKIVALWIDGRPYSVRYLFKRCSKFHTGRCSEYYCVGIKPSKCPFLSFWSPMNCLSLFLRSKVI